MGKILRIVFKHVILILLIGFSITHKPFNVSAMDDAIIAVVNDEIITLKDLKEYLNAIYLQLVSEGRPEEEIQKIMTDYEINGINQLIDDKLLVAEANKKEMQIRPKLVDERIEQIKKGYRNEQEFISALASDGLTLSDLRSRILDQLKSKYLVDMEVRNKIEVNPQEVTDFYKQHHTEFQSPEKIDLNSIFIVYSDDHSKTTEKATEALNLLKDGKSFAEVSKEYSNTPSIGWVERGRLLPALEKSIFKLQEGEISPLIETEEGIYIFQAKKKIDAKVSTLEDVKEKITANLMQKKFQERLRGWLKELREKSYVEIKS